MVCDRGTEEEVRRRCGGVRSIKRQEVSVTQSSPQVDHRPPDSTVSGSSSLSLSPSLGLRSSVLFVSDRVTRTRLRSPTYVTGPSISSTHPSKIP